MNWQTTLDKVKIKLNPKKMISNLVKKLGYDIVKIHPGKAYIDCTPYSYKTYAPWFEDEFKNIFAEFKTHTMLKEDRAYVILQSLKNALNLPGQVVECGVYKGGSAKLIATTMKKFAGQSKALHLFDSFIGMPKNANKATDSHKQGDFADTNLKNVQKYLKEFSFVKIHPGFIPKTFIGLEEEKFCFVHIDLDIYQSTLDAISFFYERTSPGGIIICDDYGFGDYEKAARKAIDEFLLNKPEAPIVLRTGQALIIKLPK